MKNYSPPVVRLTAIKNSIPLGLRSIYNGFRAGRYDFLKKEDHLGRPSGQLHVNVAALVEWGAVRGCVITLPAFISITEK